MNTNITPTPETDDNNTQAELAAWELLAEARRERDELRRWTSINGVLELQRERDDARALAESNGKLAHSNACEAMEYRVERDEAIKKLEWRMNWVLVLRRVGVKLRKEQDELREAIRETIMENLHLADGDICTLKRLKDAIGFDLDSQNKTSPSVGANE